MTKRMTIVCLPPQDKPVYFALELDWDEYQVDERQCPSDLFRNCEAVIIDGDSDPHGLFQWVRTIDEPEFLTSGAHVPDDEWPKVIPEAYPETIDVEANAPTALPHPDDVGQPPR